VSCGSCLDLGLFHLFKQECIVDESPLTAKVVPLTSRLPQVP
jgi:hypothetical protein